MTIATNATASGNSWTNVLDIQTIFNFQFGSTQPPQLSLDQLSLTYTFGSDLIIFRATSPLGLNPPVGTVSQLEVSDSVYSGFSLELATFLNAARDGDIDGLNRLLWAGRDTINGGDGNDTINGFSGNDALYGNAGTDTLFGATGADRLFGGVGADTLLGGIGADKLYGQNDDDKLLGGADNDLLNGGRGRDDLYGGAGADTFQWRGYSEFGRTGSGLYSRDVIYDFSHTEGDLIDIRSLDANRSLLGNQDYTFIGSAAFGTNTPGQVQVLATSAPQVWLVNLNYDNDASAEVSITVVSFTGAPVAADFLL